ncbi:hypothetical protein ANCDUO_10332 [Ancylostoma duodenale]|uniref:Uncharacterized protein n=1 Tax=Ancylostoma duodenale TaxID=51022 RepID=A0A0C2CRK2_9BILA|nr:hypothetical protein ANCDUO_10332 [Ancylostoma duodenale]
MYSECTHEELMSMGGRLLQWFSDMHRIHSGRDKALPDQLESSAIPKIYGAFTVKYLFTCLLDTHKSKHLVDKMEKFIAIQN